MSQKKHYEILKRFVLTTGGRLFLELDRYSHQQVPRKRIQFAKHINTFQMVDYFLYIWEQTAIRLHTTI